MREKFGQWKPLLIRLAKEAKVRKRLVGFLALILVLQLYFVRELIAAELLFGLGFVVLLVLGGIFYIVGAIGERSFRFLESSAHRMAPLARRGYGRIEEISKKSLRHARSESAQQSH
jgi:hypothetical protein